MSAPAPAPTVPYGRRLFNPSVTLLDVNYKVVQPADIANATTIQIDLESLSSRKTFDRLGWTTSLNEIEKLVDAVDGKYTPLGGPTIAPAVDGAGANINTGVAKRLVDRYVAMYNASRRVMATYTATYQDIINAGGTVDSAQKHAEAQARNQTNTAMTIINTNYPQSVTDDLKRAVITKVGSSLPTY